jgi:hypothetical protein
MPVVVRSYLVVMLVCFSSSFACALDLAPFTTSNQNPLVAVYGLPVAAPALVLQPGQTEVEIRLDLASLSSQGSREGEAILLDGETMRSTLALRRGVGTRLEIGLEIPYVRHAEGFLDNFILDWHDFFNLPQGERENFPRDRLLYHYERDGEVLINQDDEEGGFGDLRLIGGWQLQRQSQGDICSSVLRASLKLPTGDEKALLGSGSTDLALWLSTSRSLDGGSVALFGAIGALVLTDGDLLPDQQRHLVGFGSAGVGWQPYSWLAFKLQLDGHSAFYDDSAMAELSDSMQLAIGGSLGFGAKTTLDLAVVEDVVVDSAPDFVFHLALRRLF